MIQKVIKFSVLIENVVITVSTTFRIIFKNHNVVKRLLIKVYKNRFQAIKTLSLLQRSDHRHISQMPGVF